MKNQNRKDLKRIVFAIAHPKHVHMFKNVIKALIASNKKVIVLAVEKDVIVDLLNKYSIPYVLVGYNKSSVLQKIVESVTRLLRIYKHITSINPNIIVGQADPFFAICARIQKKQFIALPDTESAFLSNHLAIPLTNCIIASDSYKRKVNNIITISAYMELLYLHPNVFNPDRSIKSALGLSDANRYILIRFVAWNAHHDIGHKGISNENKIRAVKEFEKYGKVLISAEDSLPANLEKYKINIPPEMMHNVLAVASLFYGESATMAAESAILGTPAIYLDNDGRGYTDELEQRFGLLFNFSESLVDQNNSLQKGIELLNNKKITYIWEEKREKMLKDKIDFTAFLTWFTENYPQSQKIMQNNPDYQERFK